jgi:glycosyltransferase involved in cell wall biosynthesis
VRVGLIVRGGVEEGTEDKNTAPVFVELIRSVARTNQLQVFSLHGEHRTDLLSIWRFGGSVYRFAGADVFQLGTVGAPRFNLLSDVLRVMMTIHAGRRRWGLPEVLHGIGLSPGIVATFVGRLLGIPSVVSLIGGELTSMPEIGYGDLRTMKGRAIAAILLRHAGTLTVASQFMQKRVQRHGARARVMPFGIDVNRFLGPVLRPEAPPFRLLHVGTLCALKDQVTLVRAIRLLADDGLDVSLDIVGWDDWSGRVQLECDRLTVSARVRFHGWRGRDELVSLCRNAHAFVMTSLDDAAPVAVLEAAASGLPVVGTDVGFIADWAPQMAVKTPPSDPRALADALRFVLSNHHERERLASKAQSWVCQHATLGANDAYVRLYRELVPDRG